MEDIHSIKSFNWNAGIYTTLFFLIGLIYYIYKFHNFQNLINRGVYRNPAENRQNQNSENQNSQNQADDNGPSNSEQENYITIKILVGGNRETHTIHKNLPLRNFIQLNLSRHYNIEYQSVYLIYQGIRLDFSKSLSNYPQIKNDAFVHCFITSLHSNSENRSNRDNNFTSNVQYDDNDVQLQSIILHSCFLIVGLLLLFVYKTHPEMFSMSAKYVFGFIGVVWLNQFSKVIAKFIIFRRVNWNI